MTDAERAQRHNTWLWALLVFVLVLSVGSATAVGIVAVHTSTTNQDRIEEIRAEQYTRCVQQNATNTGVINIFEYLKSRQATVGAALTQDQIDFFNKAESFIPNNTPCKK